MHFADHQIILLGAALLFLTTSQWFGGASALKLQSEEGKTESESDGQGAQIKPVGADDNVKNEE